MYYIVRGCFAGNCRDAANKEVGSGDYGSSSEEEVITDFTPFKNYF